MTEQLRLFSCESPSDKCVIIFPGGGWHFTNQTTEGKDCATFFNSIGFDAFVYSYKCVNDCSYDNMLQETSVVIDHVRSLNFKQIGLVGFSAGGQIAALFLDCADFAILTYSWLSFDKTYNNEFLLDFLFKCFSVDSHDDLLKYCPIHNLSKHNCKVLLYHSILDTTVHPLHSQLFHDKMIKLGNDSTFHIARSGTHGTGVHSHDWKTIVSSFLEISSES